jgi:hypothetical protein
VLYRRAVNVRVLGYERNELNELTHAIGVAGGQRSTEPEPHALAKASASPAWNNPVRSRWCGKSARKSPPGEGGLEGCETIVAF